MRCAAVVHDINIKRVIGIVQSSKINLKGLLGPAQRIAVNEYRHGLRRSHIVTIEVWDTAHGDMYHPLIDTTIKLININQQLVVASHKVEIQVAQLLVGLNRSTLTAINTFQDIGNRINEHAIMLFRGLTIQALLHHLVQSKRL